MRRGNGAEDEDAAVVAQARTVLKMAGRNQVERSESSPRYVQLQTPAGLQVPELSVSECQKMKG